MEILQQQKLANSWTSTHSTLMASTGKYYWETKLVSFSGGSASYIGASSAYSIQSKATAGSILGTDTGSVMLIMLLMEMLIKQGQVQLMELVGVQEI